MLLFDKKDTTVGSRTADTLDDRRLHLIIITTWIYVFVLFCFLLFIFFFSLFDLSTMLTVLLFDRVNCDPTEAWCLFLCFFQLLYLLLYERRAVATTAEGRKDGKHVVHIVRCF